MATTTETSPVFVAKHRYARLTARKARYIADEIRGKNVNTALELLELAPQRAATFYLKVLRSAVANASNEGSVNVNRLVVSDARADDGPLLQGRTRWRPGPQGRAMPYRKVSSHLTVGVREIEDAPAGGSKGRGKGKAKAAGGQGAAEES